VAVDVKQHDAECNKEKAKQNERVIFEHSQRYTTHMQKTGTKVKPEKMEQKKTTHLL